MARGLLRGTGFGVNPIRDPSPALNDSARWTTVIDGNLPPRASWPDLRFRLPSLRYPDTLNLAEQLLTAGDLRLSATAIVWRDQRLSYRQLRDRVLEAAAALEHLGVRPADRVAFRLHNSPDFIVIWLAVQWVGAIGVPIPPVYRRREMAHILEHSGAILVVSSADLAEDIEAARAKMSNPPMAVSTPLDRLRGVPPPPYPAGRDFPALITYITSETGVPRGVVHSPSELLATADTYARDVLALTSRDVCIGAMSAAWSYGLGALLIFPLRVGASTALVDGSGPPLPAAIAETGATVLFAVPTMYLVLLRQPDLESYAWSSVRCCVSAAEPMTAAVMSEWQSRTGLEMLDGLGTTELAHIFISTRSGSTRRGSIGRVVAGYDACVIDGQGREVPPGVEGLLAVRGPTGARYWRDAEAQRRTVRDGWTLTGDICSQDDEGWFQYGRRADDLIVCGGYKVSPAEVQRALEDHPDVVSARVFAAGDEIRGHVPRATVTLAAGVDEAGAAERLQQHLKQELAPYKCPRTIEIA
jgi:2-aminobenzoate-CoA ligase